MGKVYADLSMSLDGYTTGPDDTVEQPMGCGGEQLHAWMSNPANGGILAEIGQGYGAVVIGRHMFDVGEAVWRPDPPFDRPVFVATHRARPPATIGSAEYSFVTGGLGETLARARAIAGEQNVWICGGANVVRQAMLLGELDELQVQVVPVLLGGGKRLFDDPALAVAGFEVDRVQTDGQVTHIRMRAKRGPAS
jgi:dihydrofolate reductase